MYPTPSAQAAEAIRKHPPNRISNRFRNIAPPRPGDTPSPTTLIGPGDVSVKWHEGQHFSIGYWTKGQLARLSHDFYLASDIDYRLCIFSRRLLTPLESAVP